MVSETNAPAEMGEQRFNSAGDGSALNIAAIFELLHQPLCYANSEGIIVRANKAAGELTGYPIGELQGRALSSLFADPAGFLKIQEETVKRGQAETSALAVLTKDNKGIPVSISACLTRDGNGSAAGHIVALTSLLQQQIQARIEQAAREWRATMDAITDMVWNSDKDCHLLRVNRAFAHATGIEPKQLIGKPCNNVFPWARVVCDRCPHKRTLATSEPATEEFFDSEKGSYLEVSTSPILNDKGEATASVCIARDVTERKQADQQIQALSRLRQYFSPKLAERLISDEDVYKVRRKNLTIFFIDIRGFTSLSDNTEPEELLNMLNEYFTEMTQIIFEFGGTVCKFVGDGIMGFFGDPEEHLNHAELAVKMALAMQSKVKTVNETSLLWTESPLAIGIGIDTGYVTLGHVGPENHRDYTVIGRHVNLAARLESKAKPGQVLISQRTYRNVMGMVRAEEAGYFEVKGFDRPVLAYSISGLV